VFCEESLYVHSNSYNKALEVLSYIRKEVYAALYVDNNCKHSIYINCKVFRAVFGAPNYSISLVSC